MKRKLFLLSFLIFATVVSAFSQSSIFGKWKTIDDETGEPKSVVEIYERNGKVFGKIVELYRKKGEDPDPICDKCPEDDPRYKKKVIGMEIIKNMKKLLMPTIIP